MYLYAKQESIEYKKPLLKVGTKMNKHEVYDHLDKLNIWYEVTEHKAVFTMDEISSVELPYPEAEAKNLFIRDDKKRNYYLITVKGPKKVNLKGFRRAQRTSCLCNL